MKKYLLTLSAAFVALSAFFLTSCEKEDPDAISISDAKKGVQIIKGKDGKEYEVVNLGLPSGNLWAVCNIGASSPEETGSFFAWGETAPKNNFTWTNYKWGERLEITKYCFDEEKGDIDSLSVLDISDDAANYIMGDGWQIPSAEDFNELLRSRNCDKKWCKLNGTGGFLFTSVKKGYEGNSLFIPLSGMQDYEKIRFQDQYGYYWCNELYFDNINRKYMSNEASVLWLEHLEEVDNKLVDFRTRYLGLPIRPVCVLPQ